MKPTIKELADQVGSTGCINVGGFSVKVEILDLKFQYGHLRYQVKPIMGSGSIWTEQKPRQI